MSRLIDADELIEHVWREDLDTREKIANLVERMPTADDWDRYSTKLWKEAYERGKKDATQTNTPNTLETLDCVSRQAAIDALRMDIDIIPYAKAREYARAVIETVYNRLERLPAAQSNLQPTCNQLATDCISRQEAIDALENTKEVAR